MIVNVNSLKTGDFVWNLTQFGEIEAYQVVTACEKRMVVHPCSKPTDLGYRRTVKQDVYIDWFQSRKAALQCKATRIYNTIWARRTELEKLEFQYAATNEDLDALMVKP